MCHVSCLVIFDLEIIIFAWLFYVTAVFLGDKLNELHKTDVQDFYHTGANRDGVCLNDILFELKYIKSMSTSNNVHRIQLSLVSV